MEEPAAPPAPGLPPPPSIVRPDVPITKRVITTLERMVKQSDRDVPWEDILAFYQMFDKPFDEEAEQQFRKRFNPENVPQIKWEPAKYALMEIFKAQDFVLTLQVDAKSLDVHNHQTIHHAQDFRYMLSQLGESFDESLYDDFIREALGKQDDTFDLKQYIELMCNHVEAPPENNKKK